MTHLVWRLAPLAFVLVFGGCAGILPRPGLRHPDRPTFREWVARYRSTNDAVTEQKALLDRALRTGNIAAAMEFFTEVPLLIFAGDTLLGREAVRGWLLERLTAGSGSFWTERAYLLLCTEGAVEQRGLLILAPLGDDVLPAVSSLYAIRWDESSGAPRIRTLSFDPDEALRMERPKDCTAPIPYVPMPPMPRTQIAVSGQQVITGSPQLSNALASEGWNEHMPGYQFPLQERESPKPVVRITHQLWRPFTIQAIIEPTRRREAAVGYDKRSPGNSSYLTVSREHRMLGLTAGIQYRNARLSAGPAIIQSDWSTLDEYRVDGGYNNWIVIHEWSRSQYDERKVGVVVEGAYAYPILVKNLLIEGHLQSRLFPGSTLVGEVFSERPPTVSNSTVSFGLGLVFGF